jgi:hypothetical protein
VNVSRLSNLPDWPARMGADVAALYMGVSKTTFLTRFGRTGIKEGANLLWAKAQLDAFIARQFAIAQALPVAEEADESWDDLR